VIPRAHGSVSALQESEATRRAYERIRAETEKVRDKQAKEKTLEEQAAELEKRYVGIQMWCVLCMLCDKTLSPCVAGERGP
jgi:hypothetical protein